MRENITKCDRCLVVIDPMEVAPGPAGSPVEPIELTVCLIWSPPGWRTPQLVDARGDGRPRGQVDLCASCAAALYAFMRGEKAK